jgi:hypothetical protein
MKRARFTASQIVKILKEADAGLPPNEVWRKHGISSAAPGVCGPSDVHRWNHKRTCPIWPALLGPKPLSARGFLSSHHHSYQGGRYAGGHGSSHKGVYYENPELAIILTLTNQSVTD